MKRIYGLVVCGGQSSRMGTDKSLLVYYDQPQRYHLYNMLSEICEKVFLSCNTNQAAGIPAQYNVIVDEQEFTNIGPMAALLSAFHKYPEANFLVAGCDYPFIRKEDLEKLVVSADESTLAVSYYKENEGIREPLLALYRIGCYNILKSNFEKGQFSLRHFLNDIDAKKILSVSPEIIQSMDTMEEYEVAVKTIQSK
jgi:molybdopterin-guanine dinucleotide biosynthesis protein A